MEQLSHTKSREISIVDPFTSVVADGLSLPEDVENEGITPVGIILYSKGSRMIALASDQDDKIISSKTNTPEGFNFRNLNNTIGDRVLNLPDYDEFFVAQNDLDTVKITSFNSVYNIPSVQVDFSYTNPETDSVEKIPFDEDIVRPVFTGKSDNEGGVVVFRGEGFPEENALLIPRKVLDRQVGFLFFLHPAQKATGLDSVNGVHTFLKKLNSEFIDNVPTPIQTEALVALEKAIQKGNITFKSDVRAELFKTSIIALAREMTVSDDSDAKERLKSLFPEQFSNYIERAWHEMLSSLHIKGKRSVRVESATDSLLISSELQKNKAVAISKIERKSQEQKAKQEQERLAKEQERIQNEEYFSSIISQLTTEEVTTLRESIGYSPRSLNQETLISYLNSLTNMGIADGEIEEKEDVLTLLTELRNLNTQKEFLWLLRNNYVADLNQPAGYRVYTNQYSDHKLSAVLEYLYDHIKKEVNKSKNKRNSQ